jgi:hypothetical protein
MTQTEIIHKRSDLTAPASSHTLRFIDCLQRDTLPPLNHCQYNLRNQRNYKNLKRKTAINIRLFFQVQFLSQVSLSLSLSLTHTHTHTRARARARPKCSESRELDSVLDVSAPVFVLSAKEERKKSQPFWKFNAHIGIIKIAFPSMKIKQIYAKQKE